MFWSLLLFLRVVNKEKRQMAKGQKHPSSKGTSSTRIPLQTSSIVQRCGTSSTDVPLHTSSTVQRCGVSSTGIHLRNSCNVQECGSSPTDIPLRNSSKYIRLRGSPMHPSNWVVGMAHRHSLTSASMQRKKRSQTRVRDLPPDRLLRQDIQDSPTHRIGKVN